MIIHDQLTNTGSSVSNKPVNTRVKLSYLTLGFDQMDSIMMGRSPNEFNISTTEQRGIWHNSIMLKIH